MATSVEDLLKELKDLKNQPSVLLSAEDLKRKVELNKLSDLVDRRNKINKGKNRIALNKLIEESKKNLQSMKPSYGATPPESAGVAKSVPSTKPAPTKPAPSKPAPSKPAPTKPVIVETLPTSEGTVGMGNVNNIGSGPASESLGTANVNYWRGMFGMSPGMMFAVKVRDPVTGIEESVMDPAVQGYQFGAYARGVSPETMAGTGGSYIDHPMGAQIDPRMFDRNLGYVAGLSVPEAQAFYWSLNDLELIKFQNDLMEGGFFKGKPVLGIRDQATSEAFGNFLQMSMANPDKSIDQLIKEAKGANLGVLRDAVNQKMYGKSGLGSASSTVTNIRVTDKQTLSSMLDVVGRELFGEYLDPAVKAQLIDKLRTQEFEYGVEQTKREIQAAGDASSQDLNAFMEAMISQESGGDPNAVNPDTGAFGLGQFMYWNDWAREAGADPRYISADNQRRVMKFKLAQYHETYGNWRDVAVAWYAGPGNVAMARAGGGTQPETYGPSIQAYANGVLSKMDEYMNAPITTGGSSKTTTKFNFNETLPSAEIRAQEELKRLDPARYFGTQFAKQADAFFSLLNGVR